MIKLDISNFRNIRRAVLSDEKEKVSFIVGTNEAGKSSICGSIQFAITGQAFGCRGEDAGQLMTHGEERMHVRVQLGDRLFNRTRSTGDSLKGNAERLGINSEILPLVFNQKLIGDGGTKHMRAFLAGAAADRFDPRVAFQTDPETLAMVKQANQSGSLTTKQVIAYCERMRAAQQIPPIPVIPNAVYPTADMLTLADRDLTDLRQTTAVASEALKEAEDVVATLGRLSAYYPALNSWEAIRDQVSKGDALGTRRDKLTRITGINTSALSVIAELLAGTPASEKLNAAIGDIIELIAAAKFELLKFPPLPVLPRQPDLSEADATFAGQLGITSLPQVMATLTVASAEVSAARQVYTDAAAKTSAAQFAHQQLLQHLGAWRAYEAAVPQHEEATIKSKAEWSRWDSAVKLIEAAERDYSQNVGSSFAQLVSELSSSILQGRKVSIDLEAGMKIGNDPIELLSESTRWRAEVATLAAIAITARSPLLIIDGADILDERNRGLFISYLMDQIAPRFEHVILTATIKGKLEDEKPSSNPAVSKWVIADGVLSKLT